jgi:hypothetical protein
MPAKPKKLAVSLEEVYNPAACAAAASKGAEQMIEVSKVTLKLAAKQNAEIVANIKKALKGTPLAELPMLDLAAQAVDGYIAVQTGLLDLTLEQINALINATQAAGTDIDKAKAELNSVMQGSMDRATVAQNSVIDYAVEQTKAGIDAVKAQPGVAGTDAEELVDGIQRGFDTVVAAQKDLMSLAAEPLKAVAI